MAEVSRPASGLRRRKRPPKTDTSTATTASTASPSGLDEDIGAVAVVSEGESSGTSPPPAAHARARGTRGAGGSSGRQSARSVSSTSSSSSSSSDTTVMFDKRKFSYDDTDLLRRSQMARLATEQELLTPRYSPPNEFDPYTPVRSAHDPITLLSWFTGQKKKTPKDMRKERKKLEKERARLQQEHDALKHQVDKIERLDREVKKGRVVVSSHEKRRNIQFVFRRLAGWGVNACVVLLVYYNLVMVTPYLTSVFWAVFTVLCLGRLKDRMVEAFEAVDRFVHPYRWVMFGLATTSLVIQMTGANLYAAQGSTSVVWVSILVDALLLTVVLLPRSTLATILTIIFVLVGVCVPLYLLVAQCVRESVDVSQQLSALVNDVYGRRDTVETVEELLAYLEAKVVAWNLPVELPTVQDLQSYVQAGVTFIGGNALLVFGGVFNLVSNVGNGAVQVLTYLGLLWYFLEFKDELLVTLSQLSPLDADDNRKIYESLRKSASRIFLSALSVGLLHALVTFLCFYLIDFKMMAICSFASGFLAMLPLLSSWVIWIPASAILFFQDRFYEALIVMGSHLFASWVAVPIIYSFIPGANSYLIGLSIVSGITAFGMSGALVGPLLTGVTVTVLEIYRSYQDMPLNPDVLEDYYEGKNTRRRPKRPTSLFTPSALSPLTSFWYNPDDDDDEEGSESSGVGVGEKGVQKGVNSGSQERSLLGLSGTDMYDASGSGSG